MQYTRPTLQPRAMLRLALVLLAFAVFLVLAATARAAVLFGADVAPSVWATAIAPALLRIVLDPTVIGVLLGVVFVWYRGRNGARASKVQAAIAAAFHIVEDIKDSLPDKAQKPVVALEKLEQIVSTQGLTLTDAEKDLAKAMWSAMHGQQKQAMQLADATGTLYAAAAGVTPVVPSKPAA